jgi:hypothetical protein
MARILAIAAFLLMGTVAFTCGCGPKVTFRKPPETEPTNQSERHKFSGGTIFDIRHDIADLFEDKHCDCGVEVWDEGRLMTLFLRESLACRADSIPLRLSVEFLGTLNVSVKGLPLRRPTVTKNGIQALPLYMAPSESPRFFLPSELQRIPDDVVKAAKCQACQVGGSLIVCYIVEVSVYYWSGRYGGGGSNTDYHWLVYRK